MRETAANNLVISERVRRTLAHTEGIVAAVMLTLQRRLDHLDQFAADYELPLLVHEVIAHDLCRSQLGRAYPLKQRNDLPAEVREMNRQCYQLREAISGGGVGLAELMTSREAGSMLATDFRLYLILLLASYVTLADAPDPPDALARRAAADGPRLLLPIAHRLGIFALVDELSEVCWRIANPTVFHAVDYWRRNAWAQTAAPVAAICRQLEQRWQQLCPDLPMPRIKPVKRRVNSLLREGDESSVEETLARLSQFSAWRLTIVVNDEDTGKCYRMLQALHEVGRAPRAGVLDSLAAPDSNGYSALRSQALFSQGSLKVKITTPQREKVNHWGVLATECLAQWYDWPPQREGIRRLSKGAATLMSGLSGDSALINVMTPQGTRLSLAADSSVLDYAFAIHTDVGLTFQCATVLREGVSSERLGPDYPLRHEDIVTITTNPTVRPESAWLDYARTDHARSRIQKALRRSPEAIGERAINQELDNYNWPGDRSQLENRLARLMAERGWSNLKQLYASVGKGQLPPPYVLMRIVAPEAEAAPELYEPYLFDVPEVTQRLLEGRIYLLRTAGCCQPRPPQPICAELKHEDLIIHLRDCAKRGRVASADLSNLRIEWRASSATTHAVSFTVQAPDRPGLLTEVVGCFAHRRIGLRKVSALQRRENDGTLIGHIELVADINSLNQYQSVVAALRGVNGLEVRQASGSEHLSGDRASPLSIVGAACPFKTGTVSVRAHFALDERRATIINRIVQQVYRNERLAITLRAPRRLGKSSLLNQLRSERRLRRFYPIHFTVTHVGPPDHFFNRLAGFILEEIGGYRAEVGESALEMALPDFTAESYMDAGDRFITFISQLQRRLNNPILLMLDEFARPVNAMLNSHNSVWMEQFYEFWKHLLDERLLHLIFAWPRTRFDRVGESATVLHRVETAVSGDESLGNFDPSTTEHYLVDMLSPYLYFEPDSLANSCYKLTAGHPLLVQGLGQELWAWATEQRRGTVRQADLDRLAHNRLRRRDELFSQLWAADRTEQQLICQQLAILQDTPGIAGAVSGARLLAALQQRHPTMFESAPGVQALIDDLVERTVLFRIDDGYCLAAEMLWWHLHPLA